MIINLSAPSDISGGGSNPNLIDNWYFADPVNQRDGYVVPPGYDYFSAPDVLAGQLSDYVAVVSSYNEYYDIVKIGGTTYYTLVRDAVRGYTGAGYTIDRWYNNYPKGVVTITDRGVKLGGMKWLIQRFDNLDFVGRAVTASMLFADGEFCYGSLVYNGGNQRFCVSNDNAVYVEMVDNSGTSDPEFRLVNYSETAEKTIIAVKLEYGDKSTLAHQDADGNWILNDPPPDKGLELLKCVQSTADPADTYANKVIYHTGNKPTAKDVGAVQSRIFLFDQSGVRLIDFIQDLIIHQDYAGGVIQVFGVVPPDCEWLGAYGLVTYQCHLDNYVEVRACIDGSLKMRWNKFIRTYNETAPEWLYEWQEFATTNYALNKAGDTMTGALIQVNGNAAASFSSDGNDNSYVYINVYNNSDWDHRRTLMLSSVQNNPSIANALVLGTLDDGTWKEYPIFHTGNVTAGTTDITAGSSALGTDCYYDVYE